MPVTIAGRVYQTAGDAARYFGVAAGTLNRWVREGRIPPPPTVRQGTKQIRHYPEDYLAAAADALTGADDDHGGNR